MTYTKQILYNGLLDKQLNSGVIGAFIVTLVEGKKPLIPGEEGYKALAVVSACIKSSISGMWAKIQRA